MQITLVAVAIHERDAGPDDPGSVVMTLRSGPSGFVFELQEVGSESGVTLTEEELAALPQARARLLDQFTTAS